MLLPDTATPPPPVTTSRVVSLVGARQLVWLDEALPSTAPAGALLCETIVSAISPGTELAAWTGLPPLRDATGYPRVQGYCNVARVLDVGSGVSGFAAGDRVLSFQSHRSHFVLAADDVLLRLAETASADAVACTYLFHLGHNAVLRGGVRLSSHVLVIGLGALGLTSVAMARAAGAQVVAASAHERARALALQMGARAACSRDAVAGQIGPGADVVIITTNAWSDWQLALQSTAMRGTIAVLGFPGRSQAPGDFNPLDSRYFYAKQLRIEAIGLSPERPDARGHARFNERDNLAFIYGEICTGRLDSSLLVSGTFPATQIERAYEALLERRDSPVTYLLRWT
jgi:NADPH:quinone reductase-like Zn-dependent oxidoreductase